MSVSLLKVVNLKIGPSGNGPVLVDKNSVRPLGLDPSETYLSYVVGPGVDNIYTSQVSEGSLAGFAESYAVMSVMNEIDHLAFKFVQDMNLLHKSGLDLEVFLGKFIPDIDVNLTENPTNAGTAKAEAEIHDYSLLTSDKITFSYDAKSELWNGRKEDGTS